MRERLPARSAGNQRQESVTRSGGRDDFVIESIDLRLVTESEQLLCFMAVVVVFEDVGRVAEHALGEIKQLGDGLWSTHGRAMVRRGPSVVRPLRHLSALFR